jgi:hypothetical protein
MVMEFVERHVKPLSAGIDWLTCSKAEVVPGEPFDDIAQGLLHQSLQEGESVRLGTWSGYAGLRTSSAFYGMCGRKAVAWFSGPHSASPTVKLIDASDNVSRLDLQLTIESTPPDKALGRINYRLAASYDGRPGCKPIVTEIHDTRNGHTTTIGSRISDQYGRNYDKGVEAKVAEAGTIWRYEVEYKRAMADKLARQIALQDKVEDVAARTVWLWWLKRGVRPTPREPRGCLIDTRIPARSGPDYLEWFEGKLSRSVRRAVDSHGLHAVLRALGLLPKVETAKIDWRTFYGSE